MKHQIPLWSFVVREIIFTDKPMKHKYVFAVSQLLCHIYLQIREGDVFMHCFLSFIEEKSRIYAPVNKAIISADNGLSSGWC